MTGTTTSEDSTQPIRAMGAEPVVVDEKVARMFATLRRQVRRTGAKLERREINGQPGLILRGPQGGVFSVMSFEVVDGRIATIRSIVNPDKLRHVGPVESLRDVLNDAAKDRRN